MTGADHEWSLCNPGPDTLRVWLEPWCEEFEVPARSAITLKAPSGAERHEMGEIEWGPDNLVIWAAGPTVAVFIDDVLQESGSAIIPIPDGLTKNLLNVIFADQPAARLGGRSSHAVAPAPWWRRVKGLLGR
ncbi:hypothetical protein ACSBM8_05525 [Sphingomonas sp. ASY06-1R]|uniref:hypothetical protein n=1 Tax=Sphingomonas sp. ASY06-1R TaxID=3445771 RepID=UPI003FA24B8D